MRWSFLALTVQLTEALQLWFNIWINNFSNVLQYTLLSFPHTTSEWFYPKLSIYTVVGSILYMVLHIVGSIILCMFLHFFITCMARSHMKWQSHLLQKKFSSSLELKYILSFCWFLGIYDINLENFLLYLVSFAWW